MLLRHYHLLPGEPLTFAVLVGLGVFALTVAITIHEFSHTLVANGLGDTTSKDQGRLSLNPLKHLDPVGTVMILLAGFGWGKPVPVNPNRLAHGAMGITLVAAAGPLSNLMVAFLLAVPIKLGILDFTGIQFYSMRDLISGGSLDLLSALITLTIILNLFLAVFNLIPLSPLDGSRILEGFIPRENSAAYAKIQQYGPVILIAVIMLEYMPPIYIEGKLYIASFSIVGALMVPVVDALLTIAVG